MSYKNILVAALALLAGISLWADIAVPVASKSTTTHAAPGETMTLSAVKDGIVYTGFLKGDDVRIGKAGASVSVRVMLSDDGNGISDVYEESKFDWLEKLGVTNMDPNADYDGNGQSNYAEYLAGMDPFDRKDYFRAETADIGEAVDGEYFKVTFEANAGRVIAVTPVKVLVGAEHRAARVATTGRSVIAPPPYRVVCARGAR